MFSSHQLRLASGRLPIDLSPKHIDYNHPGCFPYQKVKPIYSWWFQFNPFEKICNRQIGSFPQTFGMKIPKIFELPPPRKLMYVWWCLMRVPSSLTGPILLVRAQKSGGFDPSPLTSPCWSPRFFHIRKDHGTSAVYVPTWMVEFLWFSCR